MKIHTTKSVIDSGNFTLIIRMAIASVLGICIAANAIAATPDKEPLLLSGSETPVIDESALPLSIEENFKPIKNIGSKRSLKNVLGAIQNTKVEKSISTSEFIAQSQSMPIGGTAMRSSSMIATSSAVDTSAEPGTIAGQFQVSPSGAASYSIPITVPPGVAGMEPELGLQYSSQSGNGLLGIGWSLSGLSSISRCNKTIAHDGSAYASSGRLCLDGQRLKLVQGSYGADGANYRTDIDSFKAVTAVGSTDAATSYFELKTKSGLTYTYGNANVRVVIPQSSMQYLWPISRIEDSAGNYITFNYDFDAYSRSYQIRDIEYGGHTSGTPHSLKVEFTYDTTRLDVTQKHVVAGIQGHAQPIILKHRLTQIATYTGTTKVREYSMSYETAPGTGRSRMSAISECAFDGNGVSKCMPTTDFSWQDAYAGFNQAATPPDFLQKEGEYEDVLLGEVVDVNGDGLPDWVTAYTDVNTSTFALKTWTNTGNSWDEDGYPGMPFEMYYPTGFAPFYGIGRLIDLNADGLPDYIEAMPSLGYGKPTHINTGSGWDIDTRWQLPSNLYTYKAQNGIIKDINGDGLPDLVLSRDGKENKTWLNNFRNDPNCSGESCYWVESTGYKTPEGYRLFSSEGHATQRGELVDLTGDGLPEYIYSYSKNGTVNQTWLNTGNGWSSQPYSRLALPKALIVDDKARGELIDLNADGLVDYVYGYYENSSNPRRTWMNTGGLFYTTGTNALWVEDTTFTLPKDLFFQTGARKGLLVDVNKDGLPDLVRAYEVNQQTYLQTYLNSGLGTSGCASTSCRWVYNPSYNAPKPLFISHPQYYTPTTRGTIADIDGNGVVDFVYARGGYARETYLSQSAEPDLLHTVTNGLGAQIVVTYSNLNDKGTYTKGTDASYPDQDIIGAYTVVKKYEERPATTYTIPDGPRLVHYSYEGLQANLHGLGMHGFQRISAWNKASGITEISDYATTHPYSGMLEYSETRDASNRLLSTVSNTLNSLTPACGHAASGVFPYVETSIATDYEISPNIPVRVTETTSTYDTCGNVTELSVATGGPSQAPFVTSTINTYDNDTVRWYLGRLTRSEVTHSAPSGEIDTRVSSFTYDGLTGLLTEERIEPGHATLEHVKSYNYDQYGNKTSISVSGPNVDTRTTQITYTNDGKFPETITNALGHTETHEYDPAHGGRTSLTGPNGLTTNWTFDPFGRQLTETQPGGAIVYTPYRWCESIGNCGVGSNAVLGLYVYRTDAPTTVKIFDRYERSIAESKLGYNGQWIDVLTNYDDRDRPVSKSAPHYRGDAQYWTQLQYDDFDRVVKESSPTSEADPTLRSTLYDYQGLTTLQTDANGNTTTQVVDALGRTVSVTDALSGTVSYRYDAFGNLVETTDPAGNKITMGYDIRGNKTSMSDPDMGDWVYVYNTFGELTKQTDAKGQDTVMVYDKLGRMTVRFETTEVTAWEYDTRWIGALSHTLQGPYGGGSTYVEGYYYDSLGRVTYRADVIEGSYYYTGYTYDSQSRLRAMVYPSSFPVWNVYNSYGYLCQVRYDDQNDCAAEGFSWRLDHIDAFGNVESATLNNGIFETRHHDQARGHMSAIMTGNGISADVQNLEYTWDAVGNLTSRTDHLQSGLSESFSYDALNRMTYASTTGGEVMSLTYDSLGNISSKSDVGNYQYDPNRPHQLTEVTGTRAATFTYDENGNQLTSSNGRTVTWSSFNKPIDIRQNVSGGQNRTQIRYGSDRKRYKTVVDHTQNGTTTTRTTHYIGDHYEQVFVDSKKESKHHFSAYGRTYAVFNASEITGWSVGYLHTDHLGSVVAITGTSGALWQQFSYDAFGKRRNINWQADATDALLYQTPPGQRVTERGFTGHEHLDSVALVHMNGRVYDPIYGRFISADPYIQFPENTQSYNRYSYVLNNPLSHTDPSGFGLGSWLKRQFGKFVRWFDRNWRAVVSIGITVFTGGVGATFGQAFWGGFAAGLITSGGDIRAGFIGGFTAGAFYGVGKIPGVGNAPFLQAGHAKKVLLHGSIGGVSSALRGGKFQHGFLSAGSSAFAAPWIAGNIRQGDYVGQVTAAAVVGGTAAELGGGKFANGAITGAMSYSLNQATQSGRNGRARQLAEQRRQLLLSGAKDGHLTLNEANAWYRHMHGKPLTVDLNKIDISGISASDFPNGPGSYEKLTVSGFGDFLVHGSLGFTLGADGTTLTVGTEMYDFNYKSWSSHPVRNVLNFVGDVYAGSGTPFPITYRGSAQIGQ